MNGHDPMVSAFAAYHKSSPNKSRKRSKKRKHASEKSPENQHKKMLITKVKNDKELNIEKNVTKSNGVKYLPLSEKSEYNEKEKMKIVKDVTQNIKKESKKHAADKNLEGKIKKKKLSSKPRSESPTSEDFEPILTDSVDEGKNLFAWLISPIKVDDFFSNTWEKKPLHIKRNHNNFYKDIMSTPIIDELLRTENILFTKNVDITSYSNGQRETHNPAGRALPRVVWDYYLNGCSVRLLNPQTYIPKLHLLNATLQEYFKCFVGANSYLTPPGTQGFAPHYDDIEAFILQIEGKKHWRIYQPLSEEQVLPRVSSKNFEQSEIGDPILEVTLEAGDLLYFPRGFIHQGVAVSEQHSLHVTVSCYQKQSWADLFEKLIPISLENAIQNDTEFRRGLPIDIFDEYGLVHSDSNTPRREEIGNQIKTLLKKLVDHLTIDDAVDQVATKFVHSALPPVLTEQEKQLTVYGDNDRMVKNGQVINRVEIDLVTKIRLIRANVIRMVSEDGVIRIYYYVENSKEYQGNEPQFLEIEEQLAPAIETLITTYPEYVSVEQLECQNDIEKVTIANDLWERGIIMTETPLDYLEE